MATNTDIPQGYKATALGIIPQEWEVMLLGNLSNSISSGRNKHRDAHGQYPVFGSTGIIGYSSTYEYEGPVILVARVGANAGTLNFASGQYDVSDNTLIITIKQNVYDYNFAYNQLTHYKLNKLVFGSGQPLITSKQLKNIRIPVPPLAEQRKIAEVLGVWDEAIEKQARLIEKLALRKRALMQRLLSAKLRLPGFSEPWEKVKLGDIGHFLSSNTLSRDCLNEQIGNIKNIHYGDILIKLPTIVDASFIHIPYVNDDVIVKSDYLKNGDIIFADTAEDYTVGKAIEIINIQAIPVTSGLHTIPFRPKSGIFVNRFLGYYVNSTDYRRQLQPLIQGIKVYSISKTALCKTTLKIPTLSEQTAIAEVLTAADREIDLAKEKLERLRRQKRGLMQQLLTGKKRI